MDDLNPEIQIVKSSGSRYVFVMDTSESMEAYVQFIKFKLVNKRIYQFIDFITEPHYQTV